jgi:hypothetical protein
LDDVPGFAFLGSCVFSFRGLGSEVAFVRACTTLWTCSTVAGVNVTVEPLINAPIRPDHSVTVATQYPFRFICITLATIRWSSDSFEFAFTLIAIVLSRHLNVISTEASAFGWFIVVVVNGGALKGAGPPPVGAVESMDADEPVEEDGPEGPGGFGPGDPPAFGPNDSPPVRHHHPQ